MILPIPDGLPPALVLEFSTNLFKTLLFHATFALIILVIK